MSRIYTKIILLSLCLSIVPLVVVGAIVLNNTQKELKTEIFDRLNAVSKFKKNKLETFFKSRREDLRAIQGFLDVQINLPTLQEFDRDRYSLAYSRAKYQLEDQLRAFMNSYAYADILLLDKKGKVVFATNPVRTARYLDRTIFNRRVLQESQKNIYYSGPAATNEWKYPYILYMVSDAHDTDGKFAGYIVLEVDMNVIYDFISDNTGLGETGETFLAKKTTNNKYLYISPLLYDYRAILNKTMDAATSDYRGNEVLALWQDIPSLNWKLVTKIDKQEVFAPMAHIRDVFFVVCLLVFVIIVAGSMFFAEAIVELIQKLQAMTVHEPLTGVLNRRGLQDVLPKTFAMSRRMNVAVQVLLLDLDNFKMINENYGHGAGNNVLVNVAQQIRQVVRQTDHIARVGGDEFMVLLLDSRQADAVKVADKIRLSIAESSVSLPSGEVLKITSSIGIVPLGDTLISVDLLLQKLHLSLSLSKKEGKNRVTYQGEETNLNLKTPDEISAFKDILASGKKFYVASQPIFDMQKMSKIGYEFLSRMDYDGYTSPEMFLLFARNANMLGVVDHACLKTCLSALKDVDFSQRIFINIFPSTLVEVPVESLIEDFTGVGKNIRFCLEINEQQILGDPNYLSAAITKLKRAGFLIALDDYGFGNSSIETLVLLEPDIVKIDKQIIKDISKDIRKFNCLKRLLKVIESCNASVIAEGIENEKDFNVLRELGVPYGQGFFLGRPETPPKFYMDNILNFVT